MSFEHPEYWMAYLSDGGDARSDEVTVVAPEILQRSAFTRDAQVLLAAADWYHERHATERVIFAAAITRWLYVEYEQSWLGLDVDFDDALEDLDHHAPALLIQASPVARAIVANAAIHMEIMFVGEPLAQSADDHTEHVRNAILGGLLRDWAPCISRRAARS
ncbi:MAG: hypothetical protein JWM34_3306 [Ilumatobacteraceae bacterium]|nr:hypothetical protein [Ilumatobacteraceae bacterium]